MRELLELLEHDARRPVSELASMLQRSEYEVEKNIKDLEKNKIILSYNTLINWEKTERQLVTAMIEVKVTPQRGQGFDKIAERIYQFDEVDAVYLMSGGFDLCVMIHGKTLQSVAEFVSSKLSPMDSVLSTSTHFVLKRYKEHGLPLVSKIEDERMLITP